MKILIYPPSVSVVATGCNLMDSLQIQVRLAANRFPLIQGLDQRTRHRQPMCRPRLHLMVSRQLRHIYQLLLPRRARAYIARIQYRWEQGKGKFL